MKILVINCGSSSIKYQVFQAEDTSVGKRLASGVVSGLGEAEALWEHHSHGQNLSVKQRLTDHGKGLALIMEALTHPEHGVAQDLSEVGLVGHRAVHGGEGINKAVVIGPEVTAKMEEYIPLAPIHNPANLEGIRLAKQMMSHAMHVAVFDTAFHQTMPPRAFMYAVPYELYQGHRIRRYGFHGTSCRYVMQKASRLLGRGPEGTKMVICHIGNGVTVAAVRDGRSMDTSLGFTSMAGAMMGTRCGDLDPGVVLYLQRELGMDHQRVDQMLHRESGLLGVSGRSNDMRTVLREAERGDKRCSLAVEMFAYRLKKYIGSYAAAMGGLDMIAFSGGIGENSPQIRALVLDGLQFLGARLDAGLNERAAKDDAVVSPEDSGVMVAVVHTQEELMIAQEALALSNNSN